MPNSAHMILIALVIIILGGLFSLLYDRKQNISSLFGSLSVILGSSIGFFAVLPPLISGSITEYHHSWNIPGGNFIITLDPLSSFFLLPTLFLSMLTSFYGIEYLKAYSKNKSIGFTWFCFNLLVASMIVVLIAHNIILFLLAWETMALSSFFLVAFENEKKEVQNSAWIYLIATHLGTTFLICMFVFISFKINSFDFNQFDLLAKLATESKSLIFILALIGFGVKAGFIPLHIWLPEAHPAAPSQVSALMSGVMIKTGIYGLIRILTYLGTPIAWWGWALIIIGATSGILGVLFALAQHDIKRLLAYHSVENIGIIALGIGLGLLGISYNQPMIAILGFAGGLLHVLNHAIFKGLLFLGVGAIIHETGTREIDQLGGLLKKMRLTGITFLIGSIAICGLPPLNGFVSEFMIYLGGFSSLATSNSITYLVIFALITIVSLALIGGLAVACFTKVFGIVFLGEPRSNHIVHSDKPNIIIILPMVILALSCILIGLFPATVVNQMHSVLGMIFTQLSYNTIGVLDSALEPINNIVVVASLFFILVFLFALLRHKLLSKAVVTNQMTWDCGYDKPNFRMQYTASSFAKPITNYFGIFLYSKKTINRPTGIFPLLSSYLNVPLDLFNERFFAPLFLAVKWFALKIRFLQQGRIQIYVLYIAVTLFVLLFVEVVVSK